MREIGGERGKQRERESEREKARQCQGVSLTWLSLVLLSRSSTMVSIAGTALSCLLASFNPCHDKNKVCIVEERIIMRKM